MTSSDINPEGDPPPGVPGVTAHEPQPLVDRLYALSWLDAAERVDHVAPAGEGNMNLTLRVVTDRRRLVVKHARPWVEKYPQVAAPIERIEQEHRFYLRVQSLPAVSDRMPTLLGYDGEARLLAISDLGEAADLTGVYQGQSLAEADLAAVGELAAALHEGTRDPRIGAGGGEPSPLANRAMRRLNHAHIFEVPWQHGAVAEMGLDLDRFEPGLTGAAERLQADPELVTRARRLGEQYLSDGPCLLHGDLFPGSFLRTDRGIFVIDPEFAFYGTPAFDLGVWVAHLVLGGQPQGASRRFLDAYRGQAIDKPTVPGFAACEIIRRLIGVAQLPIPATESFRVNLLDQAARTLTRQNLSELAI